MLSKPVVKSIEVAANNSKFYLLALGLLLAIIFMIRLLMRRRS